MKQQWDVSRLTVVWELAAADHCSADDELNTGACDFRNAFHPVLRRNVGAASLVASVRDSAHSPVLPVVSQHHRTIHSSPGVLYTLTNDHILTLVIYDYDYLYIDGLTNHNIIRNRTL